MIEAKAEAKAETEAKALRPRPKFWPRDHFGLEDLTSLVNGSISSKAQSITVNIKCFGTLSPTCIKYFGSSYSKQR